MSRPKRSDRQWKRRSALRASPPRDADAEWRAQLSVGDPVTIAFPNDGGEPREGVVTHTTRLHVIVDDLRFWRSTGAAAGFVSQAYNAVLVRPTQAH